MWIWEYYDEDAEQDEPQKFYIELHQPIRFKVVSETFSAEPLPNKDASANNQSEKPPHRIPYSIIVIQCLTALNWFKDFNRYMNIDQLPFLLDF